MADPRRAPTDPPQPAFAERHGGAIISVTLHFAAFILLGNFAIRSSPAPIAEPETIVFNLAPEPAAEPEPPMEEEAAEEAAEQEAEEETPPTQQQAAATEAEVTNPEVEEFVPTPSEPEGEPEEIELPVTFEPIAATVAEDAAEETPFEETADPSEAPPEETLEEPVEETSEEIAELERIDEAADPIGNRPGEEPPEPSDPERREREKLAEILEKQVASRTAREKTAAEKGSEAIDRRLMEASVQLNAQKWMTTTRGLETGVIRGFDDGGFPDRVVRQVLGRYGIEILYKYIDGRNTAPGFLNQARTSAGTFHAGTSRGVHQVFSYGRPAIIRMIQLETAALIDRGLDPKKTRLIEVEYGIVRTTGGYDLGVVKLEAAEIEVDRP